MRTVGDCDRYGHCDYAVLVSAAPGEANAIAFTVTEEPSEAIEGSIVVRDTGARLRAGRLCEAVDAHAVECTARAIVAVHAGDRDDTVDARAVGAGVVLRGGRGDDHLIASPQGGILAGDAGLDTLEGGTIVDYSSERADVRIDLASQTAETRAGTERFAGIRDARGGRGDDRLIGDEGDNKLDGGPGKDLISGRGAGDELVGGAGRDVLRGGDGDDTLGSSELYLGPNPTAGRDFLDCGAGDDVADPADAPYVVDPTCEQLQSDSLGALRLRDRFALAIPRSLAGPPLRVRATVRLPGARRVERRLRFTVPKSAKPFPPGSRRLRLTSKCIDAARRRGPVILDVELRATVARLLGPGRKGDAHYRTRLRIRLPRSRRDRVWPPPDEACRRPPAA